MWERATKENEKKVELRDAEYFAGESQDCRNCTIIKPLESFKNSICFFLIDAVEIRLISRLKS